MHAWSQGNPFSVGNHDTVPTMTVTANLNGACHQLALGSSCQCWCTRLASWSDRSDIVDLSSNFSLTKIFMISVNYFSTWRSWSFHWQSLPSLIYWYYRSVLLLLTGSPRIDIIISNLIISVLFELSTPPVDIGKTHVPFSPLDDTT